MVVRVGEVKGKVRRLAVAVCEEDCSAKTRDIVRQWNLDAELTKLAERALSEKAFHGKEGEALLLVSPTGASAGALILVGLGAEKQWKLEALRRTGGILARRFGRDLDGRMTLRLDGKRLRAHIDECGWDSAGQALAEGWAIGTYSYDVYKSGARKRKANATFGVAAHRLGAAAQRLLRSGVSRGEAIGNAVNFSRDLSNAPANELYPEVLATRARAMARAHGLRAQVLTVRELTKLKMGALLGVGQGSSRPSRCIVLRYQPRKKAKKTLVLVGKAITFDSGGLSIKPAKGMEEMKFDMAGGAAVLGAMQAVAQLKPALNVVAVVPSAENMINGSAVRPGDIIRAASGKTIEVLNTDAEGRLILADALHYAQRFKPDYMLDFATLTGACVVALGTTVSGFMGNDSELGREVFEAGERCGERVWELPLYPEYVDMTRSQVADLKNSAGRWAGAITAGAFLSEFVGSTKWCHLDIAGTAWTERDRGYLGLGATGVGVRLVAELVARFEG